MKNRKIMIVAFLLVSTMVLGLGYAAVADILDIGGRAAFKPASAVDSDIRNAVYFKEATFERLNGDDEDVIPTLSATVSNVDKPNSATLTVSFNGVDGRTAKYQARGTFTVKYDADATLPNIYLKVAAQTLKDATGQNIEGMTIAVERYLRNSETEVGAGTLMGENDTVAPGMEVDVVVTVTYDPVGITLPSNLVAGSINVTLNAESAAGN